MASNEDSEWEVLGTVLVIGGGGREHALAQKLAESPQVSRVLVSPGNGGTAMGHESISNIPLNLDDFGAVLDFVKTKGISLVVIGPEQHLASGLGDFLIQGGAACFGPTAAAARLETSKAFSKDFFARHGLRTARYETFTDFEAAKKYVMGLDYRVVVKCSGLAAGKGVLLPESTEETVAALKQTMVDKAFGSAGDEVVVEEFLEGEEASLLAFCDGTRSVGMPPAQDHKRALDGDQGLNTGGMGAYAPTPALTGDALEEALGMIQTTVTEMGKEGHPYTGILYAGFILTKDGPSFLEYNCRFGDPETEVLLPLLSGDLYKILLSCTQGKLDSSDVTWHGGAAATVVAAAPGYPEKYPKGMDIEGSLPCMEKGADGEEWGGGFVYHAGTALKEGGGIVTSGGRVLTVTGRGPDLRSALSIAYSRLSRVKFEGMHFRTDIGWRALALSSEIVPDVEPAPAAAAASESTGGKARGG
eukprot:CAMPEP_0185747472 /NCGR_PEP_ID=MMETSP1174-20130828/6087_1 /TAXON_ID=35687 /ORGANISM="Dictyocha speculum, Strain CCMP1381" /LENGTH=473 /DNA_ID=CAMNT_0028422653 /DNA_START=31 /DNA_END=1448 /DNA_ORIENTATION=+